MEAHDQQPPSAATTEPEPARPEDERGFGDQLLAGIYSALAPIRDAIDQLGSRVGALEQKAIVVAEPDPSAAEVQPEVEPSPLSAVPNADAAESELVDEPPAEPADRMGQVVEPPAER